VLETLNVIAEVCTHGEFVLVYPLVSGLLAVFNVGAEFTRKETLDCARFFGETDERDLKRDGFAAKSRDYCVIALIVSV
jgi:hypothetical protein